MNKIRLAGIMLLFSVSLTGCGTLAGYMSECPGRRKPTEKIEYYQAVKTDIALWNLPEEEGQIRWLRWASKPILVVDFPISVVVDTVLLPFQAVLNISKTERATPQNVKSTKKETPQ